MVDWKRYRCVLPRFLRLRLFKRCRYCEKTAHECFGIQFFVISAAIITLLFLMFTVKDLPIMAVEITILILGLMAILAFIANNESNELVISYHKLKELYADLSKTHKELARLNEELEQKVDQRTEKLMREKEKVATTLRSLSDGVYTIDLDRRIINWNPAAEKITGLREDEVTGEYCHVINHFKNEKGEPICDTERCFFKKLVDGEKLAGSGTAIYALSTQDGREVPVNVTYAPITGKRKVLVGAVCIFRDVSDLLKVERMKTEFISMISHEIKTPLTPIIGYTNLLLNESLGQMPERSRKALKVIHREVKLLADLIETLLDISRIELGYYMVLQKVPVSVKAVIEEVAQGISPVSTERGINLEVKISPDLPTIAGDDKKIARVITNLLGNALKFVPKGGKISIGAEEIIEDKDKRSIMIGISDTGVGIARENLPRIFDKFYQVDSSATREAGGIGLGLTLAREIVELHGGKIWVESEGIGKGSKFIITLPVGG